MSRIGKKPVAVQSGVKVTIPSPGRALVEGPKGKTSFAFPARIQVKIEGGQVIITRPDDSKVAKSLHGLTRTLFANAVSGVSKSYQKSLEIQGVGYRAEVKGKTLQLSLGHSHPIIYDIPEGIAIAVDKQVRIVVSGPDKYRVGQVAAEIRGFRLADVYKHKGVKYEGELLRKKAGKAAA